MVKLDKGWVLETYPAATPDRILRVEEKLSLVLPEVYKEFLLVSNGLVGNHFSLYGTGLLVETNTAYEVQAYAPGYISVGNDGGGYHLLMKAERDAVDFRLVSSGYGVPSENDCVGKFSELMASEEGNPWGDEEEEEMQNVQLLLVSLPAGGMKELGKLKAELKIGMPLGELFNKAKDLPCVLFDDISPLAAQAKIGKWRENSIFETRAIE